MKTLLNLYNYSIIVLFNGNKKIKFPFFFFIFMINIISFVNISSYSINGILFKHQYTSYYHMK